MTVGTRKNNLNLKRKIVITFAQVKKSTIKLKNANQNN